MNTLILKLSKYFFNIHVFCFCSVLIGIGEIDLRNEKLKPPAALPRIEKIVPYLLLDVRDIDDFQKCHIKTGKYFVPALICFQLLLYVTCIFIKILCVYVFQ